MSRPFFRDGDRVTVHGIDKAGPVRGRVVCANKKSKYGLTLVVLYDSPDRDAEQVATFTSEGKRFLEEDKAFLALGWEK